MPGGQGLSSGPSTSVRLLDRRGGCHRHPPLAHVLPEEIMVATTHTSLNLVEGLRRADPRLLLVVALLTMVGIFSADRLGGLWLPAVIVLPLIVQAGQWPRMLRLLRQLRWLLLSVLLLHLLLTPGRTLFGSPWLSHDGLLRGLLVDSQLLLGAGLSLLLGHLCQPERLVAALQALCTPFGLLQRPGRRAAEQVLLVLQLAPQLADNWRRVSARLRGKDYRLRRWSRRLERVLPSLVASIDDLAQSSAAGDAPFARLQPLPPLAWAQRSNLILLLAIVLIFLWSGL